jgi:HlyD family secretion protein
MNRKKIIIPIIILVLIVTAVAFWLTRRDDPGDALIVSGSVEATQARLAFETGGRIVQIGPREGERVQAGQPLASIDGAELDAKRRQAAAAVQAASVQLAELESGFRREEIAQAAAAASAATERSEDANRDLERTRALRQGGAVSPEALQKAETAAGVAAAQLRQAREQLELMRRGPRPEKIQAARAQLEQARAAEQAAAATLVDTVIRAPHAGVVTVRHREPNEVVSPGQPVVTVMNPSDRWVRIYVPENRIGAVSLGDAAAIRSDTFPGKEYPGRVVFISPEAEFTPKSVQTTEERVRLVYAVKVRIEGDSAMELKPGMPADVELRPRADATRG